MPSTFGTLLNKQRKLVPLGGLLSGDGRHNPEKFGVQPTEAGNERLILIVDDERESRTLLAEILMEEGYAIRVADSGPLALASLSSLRPELILLDVRMPELSGLETCRRIKENPETRNIPVIFLSASSDSMDKVEGFRAGAVDFIPKPFQRDELLARLRAHLELNRLRGKLEEQVAERTGELRESEARFQIMADAAPILVWASDTTGSCTFFNRGWLEFTGRSMEEELGDGWTSSVHPDDLGTCLRTYLDALDARENFEMEYRLRREDGQYRWVMDRGVPMFQPGRGFYGYIGCCTDITELKETQAKLFAQQKLESLGVMAAGIAHDFNNLLGGVMAQADLAGIQIADGESAEEELKSIRELVNRGAEIVRELMVYAGKEHSSASDSVDVSIVAEQMAPLLRSVTSKNARLSLDLSHSLPTVRMSDADLRRVIMNLVTNAADAIGGKDGVIGLTTSEVRVTEQNRYGESPLPEGLPDGQYVQLEVSDTGCGMPLHIQARVFDPFYSTKSTGRGVGLAVVQGIVRNAGGTIQILSEPGHGATFRVFLPYSDARRERGATAG
jgi:PAS domain S-box-containing protein